MTQATNTDYQPRRWTNLFNAELGHTLALGPDESADVKMWQEPVDDDGVPTGEPAVLVDLPDDFEDEFLVVGPAPKAAPSAKPTPATPAAETEE